MEKLPSEINGLIFSYLDAEQILNYMKSSKEWCAEIKKFSKYITIGLLKIVRMADVLYFSDMKVCRLSLHDMDITDEDLKLICQCIKKIEYFRMVWCEEISDDGLKYLKDMRGVDIDECDKITDNGLIHLQHINRVILYNNKNITNAGLKHLSNINHIDLSSCEKINDEGLEYLSNVQTVSLASCENITNAGIKKLKNVKYLQLCGLKNITDECFQYLGNVEVLYVSYNSVLTDNGLKYLSNIKFLKLIDCKNIKLKGISELLKKRPKLIWYFNGLGNYGSNKMNFFGECNVDMLY
jgi:hypothetical protein